jgi:hypothetical protein
MPVHNQLQARSALLGGVIAGAAAGIVLLVFGAITSIASGRDLLLGMKFPSAWLLGERAMRPGFDFIALYVGFGTHFAVSIAWAVVFALLFYGLSHPLTLAAGLVWGVVCWVTMFYVVLPVAGLGDAARSAPIPGIVIQHLIYGLSVALAFLPFQRELPRGVFRDVARHA